MAITNDQFLQTIYVAYWGRAADPTGFDYWKGQFADGSLDFVGIAENFAPSQEAQSEYTYFYAYEQYGAGAITDTMRETFIEDVYQNMFNRTVDAEGKAYWLEQLNSGASSPGRFIADIAHSAILDGGSDASVLENKAAAAEYFTNQIDNDLTVTWTEPLSGRYEAYLATVTDTTTSTDWQAEADAILASGTPDVGITEYVGSTSEYPYNAVVYVEATFSDGKTYSGSGAIVGQNDVLTAAHVIFENGELADSITVYPGLDGSYEPYGSYTVDLVSHFGDPDTNGDGLLSYTESETDLAMLGFDVALGDSTGWFGMDSNGESGYYNLTGYPSIYSDETGPRMTTCYGKLDSLYDSGFSVYEYVSVEANPGNSGGPVWYAGGSGPYVVGVVSTDGAATDIYLKYDTIVEWLNENDYLLGGAATASTVSKNYETVAADADSYHTLELDCSSSFLAGDTCALFS